MLTGLFKEKHPRGLIGKTKKATAVFEKLPHFNETRQIKHFS